jgi:uncharacterized OsmC-like protein
MSTATAEKTNPLVNGIDTDQVVNLVTKVANNEAYGKFKFRAKNQWIHGSRNRTSIQNFYAGGKEDTSRKEALTVDADQPTFLAGKNTAPNSVEHYLHAVTSCLTTTLSYHASVQGIELDDINVFAEGDMNVRGYFGVSDEINRGYERIRITMQVKSPADVDILTKLTMYSPVYEMVSRGVPTEFKMTKL